MKKMFITMIATLAFLVGCSSDTPTTAAAGDDPNVPSGGDNGGTSGGDNGGSGNSGGNNGGSQAQGGTINFPSNKNPDAAKAFYNSWIQNFYVTFMDEVPASDWQYYSDSKLPILKESGRIKFDQPTYTVSEGVGYGLLASLFAGDKTRFDHLLNYYYAFRSEPNDGRYFMKWKVTGFKSGLGSSASDADLDIGAAFLIAYEKWGEQQYLDRGLEEASAIYNYEVNKETNLIVPADAGAVLSTGKVYNISYFSLVGIKLFATYDKERSAQWNQVYESTIAYMQKVQNAEGANGLWPDWSDINGTPADPENGSSTGALKEYWGLEGVRIPWRLVWAYSWYGDDRVKAMIQKAASFAMNITGGDMSKALNRYLYQGEVKTEGVGSSESSRAAFCSLVMIDASYASSLDACNQLLLNTPISGSKYFGPSLQLLYLELLNGLMVR